MNAPIWNDDVPDRTYDPEIKRARRHLPVIAVMKMISRGRSYKFMSVVSINRRLFRPFLAWNLRLMPRGTLKRAETEAIILRTATVCGSRYEWKQHENIGKRVGLTDRQIELITNDPQSDELDAKFKPLMTATEEILANKVLSDATWDALRKNYAPAQILEIIMLIGNYAMLAGALNTFGVTLEKAWQS